MKQIKSQIKSALKGYKVSFGDEYVNIAGPDGMHCEFYGDNELHYLTATYTIKGKQKELDFWFPNDVEEFASTVKEILKGVK